MSFWKMLTNRINYLEFKVYFYVMPYYKMCKGIWTVNGGLWLKLTYFSWIVTEEIQLIYSSSITFLNQPVLINEGISYNSIERWPWPMRVYCIVQLNDDHDQWGYIVLFNWTTTMTNEGISYCSIERWPWPMRVYRIV